MSFHEKIYTLLNVNRRENSVPSVNHHEESLSSINHHKNSLMGRKKKKKTKEREKKGKKEQRGSSLIHATSGVFLSPLDTAVQADVRVPYKLPDDVDPADVVRKVDVELLGHLVEPRKPRPWHGREIVVFVVETHIVRQEIERAVVGEGFWNGRGWRLLGTA